MAPMQSKPQGQVSEAAKRGGSTHETSRLCNYGHDHAARIKIQHSLASSETPVNIGRLSLHNVPAAETQNSHHRIPGNKPKYRFIAPHPTTQAINSPQVFPEIQHPYPVSSDEDGKYPFAQLPDIRSILHSSSMDEPFTGTGSRAPVAFMEPDLLDNPFLPQTPQLLTMAALTPAPSSPYTSIQDDTGTAMSTNSMVGNRVGTEIQTSQPEISSADQHRDYTKTAARNTKCDLCNLRISDIIAKKQQTDTHAFTTGHDDEDDYANDHGTLCRVMQCCDTCAFVSCKSCFDTGKIDSRHPLHQVGDLDWSMRGGKGKGVRSTLASTRPRRALAPKEPKKVTFSPEAKNNCDNAGSKLRRSTRNSSTRSPNYTEQLYSDDLEPDENDIVFHESSMDMLLRAASQESGNLQHISAVGASAEVRPTNIYNPARPNEPFTVRRNDHYSSGLMRSPSTTFPPQGPPAASATALLHRLDPRRRQPVTPPQRRPSFSGHQNSVPSTHRIVPIVANQKPTSVFANLDTNYADFSELPSAPSLPVQQQHFSSEHGSSSPALPASAQQQNQTSNPRDRTFGTTAAPVQASVALLNSAIAHARSQVNGLTTHIRSNTQFSSNPRIERELTTAIAAVEQLDYIWRTNHEVSWERRYRGPVEALDLVEASFTLNVMGPQHGGNPFVGGLGVAWVEGMRTAFRMAGFE